MIAFGEDVGNLGDVTRAFAVCRTNTASSRHDTGIAKPPSSVKALAWLTRLRQLLRFLSRFSALCLHRLWQTLSNLRSLVSMQKATLIVRTRGIAGRDFPFRSPMQAFINLVRGMHVLVPRNMTQAAGFYNTLIEGDDPALVVEVLNGYRLKERMPDNIGEFKLPLGMPEILREGKDLTLVTYGATVRIAENAVEMLANAGIDVELIDVQSLLPFDRPGMIKESIKKTSRVLFVDEDVPGGASAYMMQQVLDDQEAWQWLDSAPQTLSAAAHRPAYGTDGDYYSKPNAESIFNKVYEIMHESDPLAPYDRIRRVNMATKLIAPRTGEGVEELTITNWLKEVGDQVGEMESILEIETDKVVTEFPSPLAGTLLRIDVPAGSVVKVGESMGLVGEPGESLDEPDQSEPGRSAACPKPSQSPSRSLNRNQKRQHLS
jgi:pyruvate/2-oxoglutarate/acetoin dehydrogenase E1 component